MSNESPKPAKTAPSSDQSTPPVSAGQIRVKPGRHFPFHARHPWVHAHALIGTADRTEDGKMFQRGDVVELVDIDGNFLALGLINPHSRLRVRLYSFDRRHPIDDQFWCQRIDAALARRRLSGEADPQGAERLIFSESDLLSGLIVDRYADTLGVQFTAGSLLRYRDVILNHLREVTECSQIVVRIDEKTAKHEGVEAEGGTCVIDQQPQPDGVAYRQNELDLVVDLLGGQKTGGYLDQRKNHAAAARYLSGKRVLDVCCYTGGFGLVAAKHGAASVVGVDSSAQAIASAEAAAQRNGLSERMSFIREDCFDALKRLGDSGETYDAVILDPPRFAGSRKQVDQALRAYRRLNAMALDLIPPGGILVTCSCSGRVSRSEFGAMLTEVGRKKRRDLIVLENRGAPADHPTAAACPESEYLKCVIAQVM
ncbi:class I SAM-dependent rRNA methyltransferase [Rhodopirellula sp. MGV]|uniref:class I SAM-dependent rRNA methyltransferase n=1 Tax=Rhodopirellula sp. MGV TaxID=2023130 RepID=UPI000B97850C|nr:class I SAM-dependent rRNA methyltransferase [Rhodopirellula sp. MGV]OYP28346.1 SAM-dependent methyltransferase [Rhodopirellula sp. MGV]PNY38778.1 class I SAM-dependent rRNA methyltransferase [Rhodopirellula baltica]